MNSFETFKFPYQFQRIGIFSQRILLYLHLLVVKSLRSMKWFVQVMPHEYFFANSKWFCIAIMHTYFKLGAFQQKKKLNEMNRNKQIKTHERVVNNLLFFLIFRLGSVKFEICMGLSLFIRKMYDSRLKSERETKEKENAMRTKRQETRRKERSKYWFCILLGASRAPQTSKFHRKSEKKKRQFENRTFEWC